MLFRYFDKRIWILVAATMVVSALSIFFSAQIPACMDRITQAFSTGDTEVISECTRLMTYYVLASFAMAVATGVLGAKVSSILSRKIRGDQFRSILEMSPQDVDGFSAQSLSTRSTQDVETIQNFTSAITISGFALPFTLAIVVPAMLQKSIEWNAAVAGLLLAAGIAIIVAIVRIIPYFRRTQSLYDDLNHTFLEYLEGLMTVRAYGSGERHKGAFGRSSDTLYRNDRSIQKLMSFVGPLTNVMAVLIPLVIYAVSLFIMPGLPQSEQMDMYSTMIVITMYALMILAAMAQTMTMFGIQYPKYTVQRDRVDEVLGFTPSMSEGGSDGPAPEGRVEFRNVTFSYPGQDGPALRNVSFSVAPGEKVAFIGATASGKSTVLNLIQRLYDTGSGEVLVDGVDVREYRFRSLRDRMSYTMQRPELFTGTVKENIRFGPRGAQATDEEVDSALRDSGCLKFVSDLPDGADTVLDERGKNLSGGQKQRITIARAICARSTLYMFDDSFSALDAVTDAEVRDSLRTRLKDATVISVTQRIASVRDCDRIYVLDGGEIVASGTHGELLASCDYYREMIRMQTDREAIS